MKLFLTGASGFIGAKTMRVAIEKGHEVVGLVRPDCPAIRLQPFAGRFQRIDVDLRDRVAVAEAISRHKPDAVLHTAWSGVGNAARFDTRQITDNIQSSCGLVQAAAAQGVKAFVGLGSQGEYGVGSTMREDSLPQPSTLYGAAKVATLFLTRQLAAQAGMRHVWLRLFSSYGPDDNDGWLIPMLIKNMLAGKRPKTTLGTQYWDWLHVNDVACGIVAAATEPAAAGVFNLGSGRAVRVRDVIEMIRDLAAPGMDLIFGEIPFRPDQIMHMQADISKLKEATRWKPHISIEDGLKETVNWFRAHHS